MIRLASRWVWDIDFAAQAVGLLGQGLGRIQNLHRDLPGLAGRLGDADDVAGHLLRANRRLLHIPADFRRCGRLLWNR